MAQDLATYLKREQRAFLRRDRAAWDEHLGHVRGFLAEGFRQAEASRPVLVVGAGSGLEVPWGEAPAGTMGWDADPWSRIRTFLRHGRWAPWICEDVTGAFGDLQQLLIRSLGQPWSGRRRNPETAAARLAGLLPSLRPEPLSLRLWIQRHHPGTILAANFMGQLGVIAEGMVEAAFAPWSPWEEDPEQRDPLAEALEAWVRKVLHALLMEWGNSGADLWLVHDRAIVHGSVPVRLGPPAEPWPAQLLNAADLEISDPLAGLDIGRELRVEGARRWLWPVAPGQVHLMEALVRPGTRGSRPSL